MSKKEEMMTNLLRDVHRRRENGWHYWCIADVLDLARGWHCTIEVAGIAVAWEHTDFNKRGAVWPIYIYVQESIDQHRERQKALKDANTKQSEYPPPHPDAV